MSWAADGMHENGMQLEKIGPIFSSFKHHAFWKTRQDSERGLLSLRVI